VVVSAFPGGLSIQLLETGMDGMLPMRELRDDYYSFDPKRLCLVGRRSARTIGCGSELDVVVNSVDIERADVVFGLEAKGSFAQADLRGADLSEADLSEMQLFRTRLNRTNLRRAKLRAAYLQEAQAEKADLMVADLSEADCLMANLSGAKLNGANLTGAKLEGTVLRGANLSLARFDGANLKDADFSNANWWRARGLTSEQMELFRKKFAPTADAEPALKLDYEKWAGGRPR
jgi:uncharacterized protein YjbI with pentapeptide repeats